MLAAPPPLSAARRREIAELRLVAQGVVERPFRSPHQVASHLGCLQGQHLGGVITATALRLDPAAYAHPTAAATGAPAEAVDANPIKAVTGAFAERMVVRGYPMRGTVFLVAADDIAWMTEITRDRQLQTAAKRRAEHGFTAASIRRAGDICRHALAKAPGGSLTRTDLADALAHGGIALDGGQRYHLLYTLMVTGDLVYGPLHGTEHHLVDAHTWLPPHGSLKARFNGDTDAAITEWLRRYLAGHGPASLRDFQWWTKLPITTLKRLAPAATAGLASYGADGLGDALWGTPGLRDRRAALGRRLGRGLLLPPFDEVVLGYPDRELIVTPEHHPRLAPGNNGVFRPTAHRQGRIVGTWRSAGSRRAPTLALEAFEPLSAAAEREFAAAYAQYPRE